MGITQKMIVQDFIMGKTEGVCGGAGNLKIIGDKLIHYQTVIAERRPDVIILNITRYSLVTGRIQKDIGNYAIDKKIIYARGVPEGYRGELVDFVKSKEPSI